MGLIAYISVFTLFISTLPWVRRRYFLVHISIHRVFITIFLLCMALHYPGPILWYYVMPSFILFLLDRFVPKMIQASTVYPEVICSFNDDCDVVHVVLRSSKPMKPYYPGDYITIQMSRISTLYHPFTIASYWPEDPYTIELFLRVHHTSRLSWTAKLAKICPSGGAPRRVRANVDGVFGDCRHEYLRSEVIILFVAGTALTTFMGLIKAIAAQIAATNEPLRIKMYLIGTFRTRSELHAYGSFLHQISLDPRFTRWLHVTLYVSRPDRPETLVSAHDRQAENNDTEVLTGDGASRRHLSCGTIVASVASGQPGKEGDTAADTYQPIVVESTPRQGHPVAEGIQPISSTSSSADPMSAHPNPTNEKLEQGTSPANLPSRGSLSTYEDRPLPTYPAANSAVLSKRLAKLDLSMSAAMILIPLAIFYGFRAVAWEGTPGWCTTGVTDISRWTAQCMWTYAVLPGLFQIIMMAVIGYTCLAIVRIRQRGNFINEEKDMEAKRSFSEEATANTPEGATDETSAKHQQHRGGLTMPSGRDWEDGDITYRHGRMNVRKHIDEFVAAGIGRKDRTVNDGESFQGRVTVIGGGPGGFVDMVQKHTQQADWKVEYIRETWTP
ncbi:hypothetical protein BGZ73_004538 [Actinomortierella ambigua]|nr:hypothetical protein BGZ73_004538 [Actinomortierella ambigua]